MDTKLRERFGRIVRETWIAWAKEQPDIADHPHWLVEWPDLLERDKEVDRRIGEAIYHELRGDDRLLAVWWTTQEDCKALGEHPSSTDALDIPEYIKDEYRSRVGRSGRGRLWCPRGIDVNIDPWPINPIAYLAENAGGIVFYRSDLKYILPLPGFVTDLQMNKITTIEQIP